MKESTVQGRIIQALEQRGAWVVKVHQTGRGRRGIPDVIACYRGIFLAIEVKAPGGQTTDHQRVQLRQIQAAGGHAMVASSVSKVMLLLDALDQVQLLNQPELPGMEAPRIVRLEDAA